MPTLRTNDFRHVLPKLVKHIQESGVTPRLVRIEGVMRVGKTPLADMLADALSASLNVIVNATGKMHRLAGAKIHQ
jgi:predicted AAA+ superfamily ATPase